MSNAVVPRAAASPARRETQPAVGASTGTSSALNPFGHEIASLSTALDAEEQTRIAGGLSDFWEIVDGGTVSDRVKAVSTLIPHVGKATDVDRTTVIAQLSGPLGKLSLVRNDMEVRRTNTYVYVNDAVDAQMSWDGRGVTMPTKVK